MPQLQTVDLSPLPARERETPLDKTLKGFSEQQRQNRDTDELSKIYKQYQDDGKNIDNALQSLQTNPNLSPSRRIEATNQMLELRKQNNTLQQAAAKQQAKQETARQAAEKEDKKLRDNQAILADLEKRNGLEPGELKAYESDPKMAQSLYKEGKVNQADREIVPEQLRRIEKTEAEEGFAELSPADQNIKYLRNGVSKENAKAMIEPRIEQEKIKAKERANAPGSKFAEKSENANFDYVSSAIDAKKEAQDETVFLDEIDKAIHGDVAGPGFQAIVKNNPIGQLFMGLTPSESLLQAANKKVLGSTSKGTFGTKPTEREIFLLLNSMLPSVGKTVEANEASLGFLRKANAMKEAHADLVMSLTEDGTKYVPGLEGKVARMMEPAAKALENELREADAKFNKPAPEKNAEQGKDDKFLVRDPTGKKWRMTPDQFDAAIQNGGQLELVEEPA